MRLFVALVVTSGCFAKPGFSGDDTTGPSCRSFGDWGAPVRLASLSVATSHEFGAWLSPDRRELWYSRYPTDLGDGEHLHAKRAGVTGEFDPPTPIEGLLSTQNGADPEDNAQVFISDDGLDLLYDHAQTFVVVTHGHRDQAVGPFSDVGYLLPEASFHRGNATLSSDGLVLVVAEWATPGGLADLAIAQRTTTAEPFVATTKLAELDSVADDRGPSLSADGLTIVFASDRNTNDFRLYTSSRPDRDTMFDEPQLVPTQDMTRDLQNYDPTLSRDGLSLVFSSGATGSFADLYEMQRVCLD